MIGLYIYTALQQRIKEASFLTVPPSWIAVIVTQGNTSDRLQPHDVPMSGPLKHFDNEVVFIVSAKKYIEQCHKGYMTSKDGWNTILMGSKSVLTHSEVVPGL